MTWIDNATSYFLISSKNLRWKQNFHTDTFWNYILEYGCLVGAKYQELDKVEARGTDKQPLFAKPLLMLCGEIYSARQ